MKYIFLLSIVFMALACKKNNKLQSEKDDEILQQYISDKGLTATKTASGLYVVITDPGTGGSCSATSNVKVAYKGYYTTGTVFDESESASFSLKNVIAGWTEGIPYFKEGGNGILLIPSRLAYGESGSGSVPGNSVLVFDVKLIDVF